MVLHICNGILRLTLYSVCFKHTRVHEKQPMYVYIDDTTTVPGDSYMMYGMVSVSVNNVTRVLDIRHVSASRDYVSYIIESSDYHIT